MLGISEETAGKAMQWLVDNAPKIAKARAMRVFLEEGRKSLKARLQLTANAKSMAEAEAIAYAHADYAGHLEALRDAVEADEELRELAAAARLKIELFRTESANARSIR